MRGRAQLEGIRYIFFFQITISQCASKEDPDYYVKMFHLQRSAFQVPFQVSGGPELDV